MHADEVDVPPALVRRLLAAQHPQWADLPLSVAGEWGTDHAMYRLGDELVVRLPRIGWAVKAVAAEQRWLPFLGPQLPVEIPEVVATGEPGEGYPWPWTVLRWIGGEHPPVGQWWGAERLARDLAKFNGALAAIDPDGGPVAGAPGGPQRGIPIHQRDEQVRACIVEVADEFGPDALLAAWEADAFVADHDGNPVWVHGDLTPGNLLLRHSLLAGVLDFGGIAVGDPAVGLLPAWNLFRGQSRQTFRDASGVDEACWRRGRAWALSIAVVALPYYRDTFPGISAMSRHVIAEVLADHEREALGPAVPAVGPDGVTWAQQVPTVDVLPGLGGPVPPYPRARPAPRGPASFGDTVRPAADVGAADWVVAGQDRWNGNEAGVGLLVPDGFERILFVDDLPPTDTGDWWEVEKAHTLAIAEVAARHTTTPDHLFLAVWAGHGYDEDDLERYPQFTTADRDRDYYLVEGSLAAVGDLIWPNDHRRTWRQPDLWWPADRSWIVCTDVDLWCNYVAGTQALVDEVAAAVTTETHLVTRSDPFERVD